MEDLSEEQLKILETLKDHLDKKVILKKNLPKKSIGRRYQQIEKRLGKRILRELNQLSRMGLIIYKEKRYFITEKGKETYEYYKEY